MSTDNTGSIIQDGTFITGTISGGRRIEIHGHIEGDVVAEDVIIRKSGNLYGKLQALNSTIDGVVQGELHVKDLLAISSSGSAVGTIEYGQLILEQGGTLSAEVRNIPPEIGGDLDISVGRGRSVTITGRDLAAYDPDNTAEELTYSVSNIKNGFICLSADPTLAINSFTQADLEAGIVNFTHDNTASAQASFDVVVTDASGATSGTAQTVTARIIGVR